MSAKWQIIITQKYGGLKMVSISFVFSLIATVLGLIEPFGKNMKTILLFNFMGNLLVGFSYFLIGNMSGALICFVAFVQVVINFIFDVKEHKIPCWLVVCYLMAFLSVNLLTFASWYDIFALIASVLFVLSVAQSNAKFYRVLYFLNSTIWILYDFFSKAYGNLFTHIVLFIASLISIAIRDKKKTVK